MRYRIRPRIYACFTHSDRLPIVQSSITTYAVQVRKRYGWVTVKEYDEGSDSDFALRQAEELLELLNQKKMEKKYELTDEILEVGGHVLHRIKALRNFGNIKQGEIGGWIENEDNLSHCGDCWVYDDAKVYGNAEVLGDAKVCENAKVYAFAKVYNKATVYGFAEVYDDAEIFGNARVNGYAKVYGITEVFGNAKVYDFAKVYNKATVYGFAEIYGNAKVYGYARVNGYAKVYGITEVFGNAKVYGEAKVYGKANVLGDAEVNGYARICGEAKIEKTSDYIVFKNWWSSGIYFTWTRSNDMWSVGCFYGTGEELIKMAYNDSDEIGREYGRVVKYVESIKQELK